MRQQLALAALIGATVLAGRSALACDLIICDDDECETCWLDDNGNFTDCNTNPKIEVELTCGVDMVELAPQFAAPQAPEPFGLGIQLPDSRQFGISVPLPPPSLTARPADPNDGL